MKNTRTVIVALAICLSAFTTLTSCQNQNRQMTTTATVHIDTSYATSHPILQPIHLAAGGYSQYQKVVDWYFVTNPMHFDRTVTVNIPPATYGDETDATYWFWFVLGVVLGLCVVAGLVVIIWRLAHRPYGLCATNNHHYYAAPRPAGPNVPAFTSSQIIDITRNIKDGLRSGRFIYTNGDEQIIMDIDSPHDGATNVPVASATPPAAPKSNP